MSALKHASNSKQPFATSYLLLPRRLSSHRAALNSGGPMVHAVSAGVLSFAAGTSTSSSFDARRPMRSLNLAPSFPASSPKSRRRLRSCSSHTRTFRSLTRSKDLPSWCLLPLLLLHYLHSHTPLAPTLAPCIQLLHPPPPPSSIGFYTRAVTPHSSFNNTKVRDIRRRERFRDPLSSMATTYRLHHSKHRRNANAITCSQMSTPIHTRGAPETSPRTTSLTIHQLFTTR